MTNGILLFFQEVLDKKRLKLLPKLEFLKKSGFYLAGGTSLALQYGHRKSIDFDFFINKDINTEILFKEILKNFKNHKIVKTFEEKNTLYIEVDDIKVSFMSYKYNLLEDLIKTKYLNLLSDIDISSMKLWAIQNRATNKDYVDLYYILQKYSLNEIIAKFYKKFGNIVNENLIRKSLVYFNDIEEQELILLENINFEDIKKYLIEIIKKNN